MIRLSTITLLHPRTVMAKQVSIITSAQRKLKTMCKNNLGCAGKQKCGCGCPSCGKKRDNKKIIDKPVLIQTASFEPSGYGKKLKSLTPLPSGSGYSKKINLPSVGEDMISRIVEVIPQKKDDNIGLVAVGIGFGFLLLFSAIRHKTY